MSRVLQAGLLFLLVCLAGNALAAKRIDPRGPTLNATWAAGNVNATFNFCVGSTDSNNANTPPVMDYSVRASIGGTGAAFTIASGANTIPVSLVWRDLVDNIDYPLAPLTYVPSFPLTGDLRNCPTYTFNAQMRVFIAEADLAGKPPGTYTRVFTIEVENARGGGGPDNTTLTVSVVIPDSIAVTNIDDIVFGAWDGTSNMTVNESLCVYRAGGPTYGVTLTGSGAGGAFSVALGPSVVPLQVSWNDGAGAVTATPGAQLALRTNAFQTNAWCNSGAANNATLGVTALAADIAAATSSGLYTGMITITVVIQ